MSVMFASNRSQPAAGSGHLIEFKAGRTMLEHGSTPEKRRAVAKPEPGLLYIKHSQDDQLLHLYWKNRPPTETQKEKELEVIIFPGETEFLKINECTDGRVYMLKFKNNDTRHLFWMQEPKAEKDEELCKKMNELLSNPPPQATRSGAGRAAAGDRSGALNHFAALNNALGGNIEDIGALGNMDQNQLMRLFSLMNGAGTGELGPLGQAALGGTQKSSSGGAVPISALMRRGAQQQDQKEAAKKDSSGGAQPPINAQMLSQIIKATTFGTSGAAQKQQPVELSTVLTRANTQEVVSKHSDRLVPHLPNQAPLQDASEELAQTVGNPQFQQAADFFGQALQMGQIGAALAQFGLQNDVVEAAHRGDLAQFAQKLSAQENPAEAEKQKKVKQEADEEEGSAAAAAASAKPKKEEPKGGDEDREGGGASADGMDLD